MAKRLPNGRGKVVGVCILRHVCEGAPSERAADICRIRRSRENHRLQRWNYLTSTVDDFGAAESRTRNAQIRYQEFRPIPLDEAQCSNCRSRLPSNRDVEPVEDMLNRLAPERVRVEDDRGKPAVSFVHERPPFAEVFEPF